MVFHDLCCFLRCFLAHVYLSTTGSHDPPREDTLRILSYLFSRPTFQVGSYEAFLPTGILRGL